MTAAGVRVRRARLADAPAVARVMRAAVRRLAAGAFPPATLAAWSSLPALYHRWAMTAGGESYLVAERAGRVVAYAARRRGEVTAVFVHPAHAGRGVGAALLARVERDARAAGIPTLRADAARSAVGFYERLGFLAGRALAVPLPGGVTLPSRRVTKRVPTPPTAARRAAGTGSGGRRRARGAAGTRR